MLHKQKHWLLRISKGNKMIDYFTEYELKIENILGDITDKQHHN